jgi:hypothetical protein
MEYNNIITLQNVEICFVIPVTDTEIKETKTVQSKDISSRAQRASKFVRKLGHNNCPSQTAKAQ